MIGAKSFSEKCSDCEESGRKFGENQPGHRNGSRRSDAPSTWERKRDRTGRNEPLSPLRSPLRPETANRPHRSTQDKMTRSKDATDECSKQKSDSCWKQRTPKKRDLQDDDFPSLDALKFTPEAKKNSTKQDWGSIMEELEEVKQRQKDRENRNRFKRRLMLSDEGSSRARRTYSKENVSGPRASRKRKPPVPSESGESAECTPTKRRPALAPYWLRSPSERERRENPERYEQDDNVITRRQKQLDIGKCTNGYITYFKTVCKKDRSKNQPQTPNKYLKVSRRSWDSQVKIWRRRLHNWDSAGHQKSDGFSDTTSEASLEVSTTTIDCDSVSTSSGVRTPPNSQISEPDDVFLDELLDNVDDLSDCAPNFTLQADDEIDDTMYLDL